MMQTDGKLIFDLQITVLSFFPKCPLFFLKCPHFFKSPKTLSPVKKFLGRTMDIHNMSKKIMHFTPKSWLSYMVYVGFNNTGLELHIIKYNTLSSSSSSRPSISNSSSGFKPSEIDTPYSSIILLTALTNTT